jgi:hypothetical protein
MSAPSGALVALSLLLSGGCAARAGPTGHVAAGVSTASGFSPSEPTWAPRGPRGSSAAAVGCLGVTGWWITGGRDFVGGAGRVDRSPDDRRWGASATVCPTTGGALLGTAGVAYGQQYGSTLYASPMIAAGIAGLRKGGPDDARFRSFTPFVEPKLAFGLALPPGVSLEAGPYLMLAPMLARVVRGEAPRGVFWGQVGFELTVLAGAGSPVRPWRD